MRTLRLTILASALLWAGCAGSREPAPLTGPLPAPGFAGQPVLVFPVQMTAVPGDPTRELTYALEQRRGASLWVLPNALRSALERSPQLAVPVEDLPVSIFLRTEVRRIGDPLYGILRRAAAVTEAEWALIPVAASWRPPAEGAGGAVMVKAAVIDVLTGRVRWLDDAEGSASAPDDPGGLARAMEDLARQLLPGG